MYFWPEETYKEELEFMDLWLMACIVDGKPFDLAYLFFETHEQCY